MTTLKVFTYWLSPVPRAIRKWWLRRKLAHAQYEIDYLRHIQREHWMHERYWHGQVAVLQSELHSI